MELGSPDDLVVWVPWDKIVGTEGTCLLEPTLRHSRTVLAGGQVSVIADTRTQLWFQHLWPGSTYRVPAHARQDRRRLRPSRGPDPLPPALRRHTPRAAVHRGLHP